MVAIAATLGIGAAQVAPAQDAGGSDLPPLTPDNINADSLQLLPLNGERFPPEDRTAEALASGRAALARIAEAYAAAPAFQDTVIYTVSGPGGAPQEESFVLEFEGDRSRVTDSRLCAVAIDGTLYVTIPEIRDRYLGDPYEGPGAVAIGTAFGTTPAPDFMLRTRPAAAESAFSLLALDPVTLSAARQGEFLFTGPQGDASVTYDEGTALLTGASLVFTPPGAPEVIRLRVDFVFTPKVMPSLPVPIAFDTTSRARVSSLDELLGKAKPLAVGDHVPALALTTLEGEAGPADVRAGKVAVLEFWATWCGPCRRSLALVGDVARWARAEGLDIVVQGINVMEEAQGEDRVAAVRRFWNRGAYGFPTFLGDDAASGAFALSGIPATYVIGRDGRIAAIHVGFDPKLTATLKAEVTAALATGASAPQAPR